MRLRLRSRLFVGVLIYLLLLGLVGAIGFYTYYQRLAQGLRQLMAGARKFGVKYIDRSDIAALTPEASAISGVPMVSDVDREEAVAILAG